MDVKPIGVIMVNLMRNRYQGNTARRCHNLPQKLFSQPALYCCPFWLCFRAEKNHKSNHHRQRYRLDKLSVLKHFYKMQNRNAIDQKLAIFLILHKMLRTQRSCSFSSCSSSFSSSHGRSTVNQRGSIAPGTRLGKRNVILNFSSHYNWKYIVQTKS